MKKLVIIGAGDTGREIVYLVERINSIKEEWELLGFVDDNRRCYNELIEGYPVLGNIEWLNAQNNEVYAICSIGNPAIKKLVISKINNRNVKYATLIDPMAIIGHGTVVEEGSIIYANAITSINGQIGKHVYVSLTCTIGHDTIIGNYCSMYPGCNVSGKVTIEECCELGTGTKIIQGINIHKETTLGAGTVVVKDILERGTYIGVPAKKHENTDFNKQYHRII